MTAYLLTAAGVIFFSVIVSLIIPDGKLNKSIIFVMRMACVLVLLQPITGLFKINSTTVDKPLYDYEYICNIYSANQSKQMESLLSKEFNADSDCIIEVVYDDGNFKVESVTVELNSEDKNFINNIYEYLDELGYINITVYAKSY